MAIVPAIIATSFNGGTAISAFAYDDGDAAHLEAVDGAWPVCG